MDLRMPGIDGVAAIRALAERGVRGAGAGADDLRHRQRRAAGDRGRRDRLPAQGRAARRAAPGGPGGGPRRGGAGAAVASRLISQVRPPARTRSATASSRCCADRRRARPTARRRRGCSSARRRSRPTCCTSTPSSVSPTAPPPSPKRMNAGSSPRSGHRPACHWPGRTPTFGISVTPYAETYPQIVEQVLAAERTRVRPRRHPGSPVSAALPGHVRPHRRPARSHVPAALLLRRCEPPDAAADHACEGRRLARCREWRPVRARDRCRQLLGRGRGDGRTAAPAGERGSALEEAIDLIRAALDVDPERRVVRGAGPFYPVSGYPAGPPPAHRVGSGSARWHRARWT